MVIILTEINKQIKENGNEEGGTCENINKVARESFTDKWMFNKGE